MGNPLQEYYKSWTLDAKLPVIYLLDIQFTHSCTPLVVIHNCTLSKFIAAENRCSKFINRDLILLQPSKITSTFKNVIPNDNSSVQVSQSRI